MADERLKAAASLAGLSPEGQKQVDGLIKALATHRELLGLPENLAAQRYAQLPEDQKKLLPKFDDPKLNQGWFASAKHYIASYNPITLGYKGIVELSDNMSRLYRSASIMGDQGKSFGDAWAIANDKGNKVFRPDAIADAENKYGTERVQLAMKLVAKMQPDDLAKAMTEREKVLFADAQNGKDPLLEQAIRATEESKYSIGRDVATAMNLKGKGSFKWVSGFLDTAFLLFADPTIVVSKVRGMVLGAKYSTYLITDATKVAKMFAKPTVAGFWDEYGAALGKLDEAKKAGDMEAAALARTQLKRLAPQYDDKAIAIFNSPQVKIRNATDAKNYAMNTADAFMIMAGNAARTTPLMPRLNAAKKAKLAFYTTGDKVLNFNAIGKDYLRAAYVADDGVEDIVTGIMRDPLATGQKVSKALATNRYSEAVVYRRLDKFARKFEKAPVGQTGPVDLLNPNTVQEVYQIAAVALPRPIAKVVAESFDSGTLGQKIDIYKGLWKTVYAIRGANKTEGGMTAINKLIDGRLQTYAPKVRGKDAAGNPIEYRPDLIGPDDTAVALAAWQTENFIARPSIAQMDAVAARTGLWGRIIGASHRKPVEQVTDFWTLGTLVGPRTPARNALEDYAAHLAIGGTPLGYAKGRWAATVINMASEGHDLGLINRFVKGKKAQYYTDQITAIKADKTLSPEAMVDSIREVTATAIGEAKMMKTLTKLERRLLQDQIRYGNVNNMMESVTDGLKMALRGTDDMTRALAESQKTGATAVLKVNGEEWAAKIGSDFKEVSPAAGISEQLSWLTSIHLFANDEVAGAGFKALLKGDDAAIAEMVKVLKRPEVKARFRIYDAEGMTETIHARRLLDTIKNLVSKSDGTLNTKFYKSLFTKTGELRTGALSLEDLPKSLDEIPQMIVGPQYVPIAEAGNISGTIVDKAWDGMAAANGRWSRQPIVLRTMLKIRKDMHRAGADENFKNAIKAQLSDLDEVAATKIAEKQLADYVEQKAVAFTLAYVDNPAVRSQLAWSARNFARFYRATEDFYRRMLRTAKYNPQALAKFALTYDGVAHSGWLEQDAAGEKYFIYPAMTPVYTAVQSVFRLFGMEDAFKAPLPVQFNGKLNMITPSMNPESLQPTFAGPLGSFSVAAISNIIGGFNEDLGKNIKAVALGPYAEDQNIVDLVLPAHVRRAWSMLDTDERVSRRAGASRKAITYLASAGLIPQTTIGPNGEEIPPTAAEMQTFKDRLNNVVGMTLMMQFVMGFALPASPQLDYRSDIDDWVRDAGFNGWKQQWRSMLAANKNDYEKTLGEWVERYPDQLPYSIAESQATVAAQLKSGKQAQAFIEQNKSLFSTYREGAAFLMPMDEEFTFDSYKVLKNNGLYESKLVGDFLKEVAVAGDKAVYYMQKKNYEATLAATPFEWEKKQMAEQWTGWSKLYLGARPLLKERLQQSGAVSKTRATAVLSEVEQMLADPSVRVQARTRSGLKQMLDLYYQYQKVQDYDGTIGGNMNQMVRDGLVGQMQDLANLSPNVASFFTTVISPLIEEV